MLYLTASLRNIKCNKCVLVIKVGGKIIGVVLTVPIECWQANILFFFANILFSSAGII